jgi:methyl-accepting chemotaxis protein
VRGISRPRAARRTIRTRILAIAWGPTLVLLIVGVTGAGVLAWQGASSNRFADSYVRVLPLATRYTIAVQLERQRTIEYMLNPAVGRKAMEEARAQDDAAGFALAGPLAAFRDTAPASFNAALNESIARNIPPPEMRKRVDEGTFTVLEAAEAYGRSLSAFPITLDSLAANSANPKIAAEYEIGNDLIQIAESRSLAGAYEQALHSSAGLSDQEFQDYVSLVGGYRNLLKLTTPKLTAAEQAKFAALTASPAWQQLSQVEKSTLESAARLRATAPAHRADALPISADAWQAATSEVSAGLVTNSLAHLRYATDRAADHSRQVTYRAGLVGLALLLLSLLVFAIVTRLSTRLIKRLTRLQSETLEQSTQRLPTIMDRLSRGEAVDVDKDLPPLEHGNDEIGQVADAFNRAQRSAVAAAVKESETRAGTSKVFLNIAHRSQIVAHRQLKLLDQAERTQEDPDQLGLLFQLDHLTTRARRNAENLIILGGGQPGRRWRNPVPLLEIVRSAVGEAETYTGITIDRMPKVSVAGAAVADLIHLLAELVDNATAFSPPTARVEVRGNVVGRGIVIEIDDQGLGIEPDQLVEFNAMLQQPPDFGVMALAEEPRLGLFVVTQLAVRHGIRVTLTESPSYGGVRAIVLIPTSLITTATPAHPEIDNVAVVSSLMPSRRANRMISIAQPPALDPPASPDLPLSPARPMAPERPATHERPAAHERPSAPERQVTPEPQVTHERQTAPERPVAPDRPAASERRAEPSGPVPVVAPGFVPALRFAPSRQPEASPGPPKEATTAEIPVIRDPALDRDHRPALPQRTRQAHLAPQLARGGRTEVQPQSASVEGLPSAESARDRFAAFQNGTRRGRQGEPN